MEYAGVVLILIVAIHLYFKIAERYGIADEPGIRSSHQRVTIRGGGVIVPIAYICLLLFHPGLFAQQPVVAFSIGLLLVCIVSFVDDLANIPPPIRLFVQALSVSCLFYFFGAFSLPMWTIPLLYILAVGILNAYNFMDGINGMTGLHTLMTLLFLLYINRYMYEFVDARFIVYPILATVVFLFFNFRKNAKCFIGDIGSMALGFWVLALLGLLVRETGNFKWILFLTVYGAETVLTMVERLRLGENIFQPHRIFLFQLLVNERKLDHRLVSTLYTLLQAFVNLLVIGLFGWDWLLSIIIVLAVGFLYIGVKASVRRQIEHAESSELQHRARSL